MMMTAFLNRKSNENLYFAILNIPQMICITTGDVSCNIDEYRLTVYNDPLFISVFEWNY
jgi:hypothetical protein